MPDQHKALLRRYLGAYNRGALDELDAFLTPAYTHWSNGQALTLAQFKRGAAWLRAGMPDFAIEAVDMVEEGDRLAVRWKGRAIHTNAMFGEAVTGRPIVVYGATTFRFEDDRIAEDWEVMDEADLRRQVGALTD